MEYKESGSIQRLVTPESTLPPEYISKSEESHPLIETTIEKYVDEVLSDYLHDKKGKTEMQLTSEKEKQSVSPLITLLNTVLISASSSGLTEEDREMLSDDLATLAVLQRLAFRALAQEREMGTCKRTETPRLNADFDEVL